MENSKQNKTISDILDSQTPVATRSIMTKLGVKKSKGFSLSDDEFRVVKSLWKLRDEGLIRHVEFTGWILTERGSLVKEIKNNV